MHAQILEVFFIRFAIDIDEHGDFAAGVDVGLAFALRFPAHDAADLDVFTDLIDQVRQLVLDLVLDRVGLAALAVEPGSDGRQVVAEFAEDFVLGDEIGLAQDLDEYRGIVVQQRGDTPFIGAATSFLGGLYSAGLAQLVDCFLDVSIGFNQGLLAIHHAGTGLFAQFSD
jgi:hypothetical protein